jgi:hypothetical protein
MIFDIVGAVFLTAKNPPIYIFRGQKDRSYDNIGKVLFYEI